MDENAKIGQMVNMSTNFYLKKYQQAEFNKIHIGQIPNGQNKKFKSNLQIETLSLLCHDNWIIYDEYENKYSFEEFLDKIGGYLPFIHPNTIEEIEIREWF